MGRGRDWWVLTLFLIILVALAAWIIAEPLTLESTVQIVVLLVLAAITAWYAYETRRISRSSQEAADAASKQAIATQGLLGQRYFAQLVALVIDPLQESIQRAKEILDMRNFAWANYSLERALEILDKDDVSLFEQSIDGRTLYSIPFPQIEVLGGVSGFSILQSQLLEIDRKRPGLVSSLRSFDKEITVLRQELARLAVLIGGFLAQNWKPVILVGGYESPSFITDEQRKMAIVNNAFILFADFGLSRAEEVSRALDLAKHEGRSLVVVADRVEGEALATLAVAKLRGEASCLAVRTPGSTEEWKQVLREIASLMGGTVLSRESQLAPNSVTIKELGRAHRIVAGEHATRIAGGEVDEASPAALLEFTWQHEYQNSLRQEIAKTVFLSLMLDKSHFERFLEAQDQAMVLAYAACEQAIQQLVMKQDVQQAFDTVARHCQSLAEALSSISSQLSGLWEEIVSDYQLEEAMISELKEKHWGSPPNLV